MSTGHATIRGRNGKSASGKKVSVYSPQYKQTTGHDAPDRGETSAAIAMATDLTTEQKAAANAVGWSYEQAKAYDPSTQVVLKNGSVINKIQRVGSSGKGEAGVQTYVSKSAYTAAQEARKSAARTAAQAQAAAAANYQQIRAADGSIIDAIQTKGAASTGENAVRYVSGYQKNPSQNTVYSKSARTYTEEARARSKLANTAITSSTSEADKQVIQQARAEVLERTSGYNRGSVASGFADTDKKASVSLGLPSGLGLASATATEEQGASSEAESKTHKALSYILPESDINRLYSAADYLGQKIDKYNAIGASYLTGLPTGDELEETLTKYNAGKSVYASPFAGLALAGKGYDVIEKKIESSPTLKSSKVGQLALKSINAQQDLGSALVEGTTEFVKDEYDDIRTKPVSKTAEYAALYAGGEVLGAVTETAKIATASKFLKLGEKTSGVFGKAAVKSPILKNEISWLGKSTGKLVANPIDASMGVVLAGDYANAASEGYVNGGSAGVVKSSLEFGKGLAIGGKGYHRGIKAAKDPVSVIPLTERLSVQKVYVGGDALVSDINVGRAITIGNRPIISRTSAGIKLGTPEIPESILRGNRIQTFSRTDTRMLEKTLRSRFSSADNSLYFSGKKIASTAYGQKRPVTYPESLEISSRNIPDSMKPLVKETVIEYAKDNEILVYGSAMQKIQMQGYFSRQPKDLEVSVDSAAKFVSMFRNQARKAGLIEGKDYRITVEGKVVAGVTEGQKPKIEFAFEDGQWKKGIEVFESQQTSYSMIALEKGKYKPEDGLPYGFEPKEPIVTEGVDILSLQEQAVKKFEGSTTLFDGLIQPKHKGRIKDIGDLIELGVANEATFKTGIKDSIIEYTKTAVEKHPTVRKSPIADYIANTAKVPNRAQAFVLNSEALLKGEKDVLVRAIERKEAGTLVVMPARSIRSGSGITIGQSKPSTMSRTKTDLADMIASETAMLKPPVKKGALDDVISNKKLNTSFTRRRESLLEKTAVLEDRDLIFDSLSRSTSRKLGKVSKPIGSSRPVKTDITIPSPARYQSKDVISLVGSTPSSASITTPSPSISSPSIGTKSLSANYPSPKSSSPSLPNPSPSLIISKPRDIPSASSGGGGGYTPIPKTEEYVAKRMEKEDETDIISPKYRYGGNRLISKTKVATFAEMFGFVKSTKKSKSITGKKFKKSNRRR